MRFLPDLRSTFTPMLLDAAGAWPKPPAIPAPRPKAAANQSALQGRSYWNVLKEEKPAGWDEINASHTFHEITMYYPMRVVRDRRYKLIWSAP